MKLVKNFKLPSSIKKLVNGNFLRVFLLTPKTVSFIFKTFLETK